ncbi:MAG TPA: insulinase family protein [Planctomycetes bacterium]|nr:insulinase family protein [Planctomycetota bacterium]
MKTVFGNPRKDMTVTHIPHERLELPNGLVLILHEDHRFPLACVNLWYGVGAKDETPGRTGFAHLFEHLMFMGTDRVPEGDFDAIMESGGGWNNATTSEDRTDYYDFGPAELLPTLLWLEADRLESLGRCIDQDKLDRQREVVRNERRQSYEMAPYGRAELILPEFLYPADHPYAHSVIGSHEDLEAATVEDVRDFFETWYTPANLALVVAGDFDRDETVARVDELFGNIESRPVPPRARRVPASLSRPRRLRVRDKVQHPRITLVWHTPALFEEGDAALDLASSILGGGRSSRLYQRLIQKEALATRVRAGQLSMQLTSLFEVEILCRPGADLKRVESIAREEIARFRNEGPDQDELLRQVATEEVRILSSLEPLLNRALRLNQYEASLGHPDGVEEDLDRYRKLSTADIQEATARWLGGDGEGCLVVQPEDSQGESRVFPATAPAVERRATVAPERPEVFRLGNGLTVTAFHRASAPMAQIILAVAPGAAADPPELCGRTALLAGMLDEGAPGMDAEALSQELERLGAQLRTGADQQRIQAGLSILPRNLGRGLALLHESVIQAPFLEKEWERVHRIHLESLAAESDDPGRVATRVAPHVYFGTDHPYGWASWGHPETMPRLTRDQIIARHAEVLAPSNMHVFVVSALEQEELRSLLDAAFGKLTNAAPPPSSPTIPAAREHRGEIYMVHHPDAVQTVIRAYMPAPPFQCEDRVHRLLLNGALGGSFTSRLNRNLREEKGWTYGIQSSLVLEKDCGYHVTATTVEGPHSAAAVQEILKEIQSLRDDGMTEDELAKAKQQRRASVVESLETSRGLLNTAASLERVGASYDTLEGDLRLMEALSLEEVNARAKEAFPLEKGMIVLVGDRESLSAQLAQAGLPAPRELTPLGDPLES